MDRWMTQLKVARTGRVHGQVDDTNEGGTDRQGPWTGG